jgi:hypothetical protein
MSKKAYLPMRKNCKRKHWPLVNTILHASEGAAVIEDKQLLTLRNRELSAIYQFETHTATLQEFSDMCAMLGVAETMAKEGIGAEVLPACELAQAALIKLKTRFEKWHKFDAQKSEVQALRELYEWHDLQRKSVSRSEYDRMIKLATNRMKNRAPGVVEI